MTKVVHRILKNKIFIIAIALVAIFFTVYLVYNKPQRQPVNFFDSLPIKSDSVYVYDQTSQTVLYERNAYNPAPLASITKLMTAIVASETLDLDSIVPVSITTTDTVGGRTLYQGEKWRLRELIQFMIFVSSNNAAESLLTEAEHHGINLITKMNQKAKELDLFGLSFNNVTGLDVALNINASYGSAKNISDLLTHIYKNYPWFFDASSYQEFTFYSESGTEHKVWNTNSIVSEIPGIIGSKTGFTEAAGGSISIILEKNGHIINIVILGSTQTDKYEDLRLIIDATNKTLNELTYDN